MRGFSCHFNHFVLRFCSAQRLSKPVHVLMMLAEMILIHFITDHFILEIQLKQNDSNKINMVDMVECMQF